MASGLFKTRTKKENLTLFKPSTDQEDTPLPYPPQAPPPKFQNSNFLSKKQEEAQKIIEDLTMGTSAQMELEIEGHEDGHFRESFSQNDRIQSIPVDQIRDEMEEENEFDPNQDAIEVDDRDVQYFDTSSFLEGKILRASHRGLVSRLKSLRDDAEFDLATLDQSQESSERQRIVLEQQLSSVEATINDQNAVQEKLILSIEALVEISSKFGNNKLIHQFLRYREYSAQKLRDDRFHQGKSESEILEIYSRTKASILGGATKLKEFVEFPGTGFLASKIEQFASLLRPFGVEVNLTLYEQLLDDLVLFELYSHDMYSIEGAKSISLLFDGSSSRVKELFVAKMAQMANSVLIYEKLGKPEEARLLQAAHSLPEELKGALRSIVKL